MNESDKYMRDKATVISIVKYILIALIACVVIFFFSKLVIILIPFLIGFILAKCSFALAEPLANRIKSKPAKTNSSTKKNRKPTFLHKLLGIDVTKPKKSPATKISIVIYVILLIALFIGCAFGIIALIAQANKAIIAIVHLAENFNYDSFQYSFLERFSRTNGGFLSEEVIKVIEDSIFSTADNLLKTIPDILTSVVTFVWNFIGSLPTIIFTIICIILSGYYFIADGPTVTRFYLKNVPNKSFRKKSLTLLNELSVTLFRVLGGYILLLIITFVESVIVFKLANTDYIIILSLITAVIDFLPVLGISATMIPVMVYCALQGNYTSIVILIIGMAIMTVIRRIIEPVILGKSMKLHPLLMLVAMVIGVYVYGAIGFLLGPTVMIIVIQTIKAFGLDKKILAFMSRVLKQFMRSPEAIEDTYSSRRDEQ